MAGRDHRWLGTALVLQVSAAIGLITWRSIGSPAGGAALASMLLIATAICIPPIRRRIEMRWRKLKFAIGRARHAPPQLPPAFDVPLPGGGVVGARWAGDTLITMLGVRVPEPTFTVLTPHAAEVADGCTLALTDVASQLTTFDITVASIDVISHDQRLTGPAHVAGLYDSTLGPLPAVARRTMFLVIRLRGSDCADAVIRRGGGLAGAQRAVAVTTTRIATALRSAGHDIAILDAHQIDDATGFLTNGADLSRTEERWSHLRLDQTRVHLYSIPVERITDLMAHPGWSAAALSTTLSIRLKPGFDGPQASALLRVDERPDSGQLANRLPDFAIDLPGNQFGAFTAALPFGQAGWDPTSTPLHPIALPIEGMGQLIGADDHGRGLAVPLYDGRVGEIALHGSAEWIGQFLLRSVAVGAHLQIRTDAPDRWQSILHIIGDATSVRIIDGDLWVGAIEVIDETSADDLLTVRIIADPRGDASLRADLRQSATDSGVFDIGLGDQRRRVAIVSTRAERALLRTRPALELGPERTSPLQLQPAQ